MVRGPLRRRTSPMRHKTVDGVEITIDPSFNERTNRFAIGKARKRFQGGICAAPAAPSTLMTTPHLGWWARARTTTFRPTSQKGRRRALRRVSAGYQWRRRRTSLCPHLRLAVASPKWCMVCRNKSLTQKPTWLKIIGRKAPLSKPTTAAQPWRRELVFMPLRRHSYSEAEASATGWIADVRSGAHLSLIG